MYTKVSFCLRSQSQENVKNRISSFIAEIDRRIDNQINAIIHHDSFQDIEARWKSLCFLVDQLSKDLSRKDTNQLKILNVTKSEIQKDFSQGLEFDQSHLFRLIYSQEFGTPGGVPFSMITVDFEVLPSAGASNAKYGSSDLELLKHLAATGASSFCPFVIAASRACFGVENWQQLRIGKPLELPLNFDPEYGAFRNFRDSDDARFLALAMPRFKLRKNWNTKHQSFKSMRFLEKVASDKDVLWGNASIAFVATALKCFQHSGWFLEMRGLGKKNYTGGQVPLPKARKKLGHGELRLEAEPKLEVFFDELQERKLVDAGLLPLVQPRGREEICFFSNQSIQKVSSDRSYDENFEISSMLQYMLCVSRFAHHIKIMIRDKIGSYQTSSQLQSYINNWLRGYTINNPDVSPELMRARPLRHSKVQVSAKDSKPGTFQCKIDLTPHCQLEHVASSLKLVTELSIGEHHGP